MIRLFYGDNLGQCPTLANSMFRDRAAQFDRRLKWDVTVNADGLEKDEYDKQNPLYVIWQLPDGSHGGSMRFLPTVGPTMVNDHFLHLTDGVSVCSPLIWESTRFCISQRAENPMRISAKLMLAGAELGRRFYLRHAVGVFDAPMIRVYHALGWTPDVISQKNSPIAVGLWDFGAVPWARLHRKSGLNSDRLREWFDTGLSAPKASKPAGIRTEPQVLCP